MMEKNFGIYNIFLNYLYNNNMNSFFISELQEKEIISMVSGESFGHIVDINIDDKGNIIEFIAETKKVFLKPFHKENASFSFNDIEKIGKDVILVRV